MGTKTCVMALVVAMSAAFSAQAEPNYLMAEQNLVKGQKIMSNNGRYMLIMQNDGNLVLYFVDIAGKTMPTGWSTGRGGEYARMQQDGNLAVYNSNGTWRWQAGNGGQQISQDWALVLGDDGSLQIYRQGVGAKFLYTDFCGRSGTNGYYQYRIGSPYDSTCRSGSFLHVCGVGAAKYARDTYGATLGSCGNYSRFPW